MKTTPPPEPGPGAADDLRPEYNFDYRKARPNRFAGLVDTMRFVGQFTVGYGDYTSERDELFRDMTLDDMIADIEHRREQTDTQPRRGA